MTARRRVYEIQCHDCIRPHETKKRSVTWLIICPNRSVRLQTIRVVHRSWMAAIRFKTNRRMAGTQTGPMPQLASPGREQRFQFGALSLFGRWSKNSHQASAHIFCKETATPNFAPAKQASRLASYEIENPQTHKRIPIVQDFRFEPHSNPLLAAVCAPARSWAPGIGRIPARRLALSGRAENAA